MPVKTKTPVIIVNFKTYPSGTGSKAEALARLCKSLSGKIIVAAQAADIHRAAKTGISVFAQHIDPVEQGKNTGFITAESVKEAGAFGTLINHAEHKIPMDKISKCVERARQNKLAAIVCAASTEEAVEIAKNCSPDYIAIEPPELIAGIVGVSTANPEIITKTINAVNRIKKIPIICGAGVSSSQDVSKAIELGTAGVLVANFVMSAKDQKAALKELLEGLD